MAGTLLVAIICLLASTGVQILLPAGKVAVSPAPFADAVAGQWGGGAASLAALAIAIGAFGCLNALILGSGELAYALDLGRDLPERPSAGRCCLFCSHSTGRGPRLACGVSSSLQLASPSE